MKEIWPLCSLCPLLAPSLSGHLKGPCSSSIWVVSHGNRIVLQDVLAICGGNLPAWVKQLVFDCKFLFPFDLRRRYFYCTAPGLARALQHLQQQQTAEGATSSTADRELRVSRIQRSKVSTFPFLLPLALAPVLCALLASQNLAQALSYQVACARLTQQRGKCW